MKRLDFIFITLIGLVAFLLGGKLIDSLGQTQIGFIDQPLTDLSAFEKRIEAQIQSGEDIYLLARQWEWSTELTLKEGKNYKLHIASGDIQHAFHLEKKATGHSIDILLQPGREYVVSLNNLTAGVYAIGCTQYCGIEHNKMRGKLIVLK
ncbi:hypothetical protein MTBPR1_10116 [Candidatus Terasakiella magnetica]|uniref:Cytochrome oxidase subunit II copper A binding domain-containing protein n=1 Tax=Candidatus Terasakiella magnetica TaxID=1867952 RepID=A0A1C3RC65_9PROT|nr:hypothetical protein [Candidatus Terasakiella magnetica]SCA54869.1 hypothetical protein MTBPR1_10116 [Candidatus Terasakiella magnetica]